MNPYRELGLGDEATEADIKRAYARLIKQHRPDTDPDGFQRVHEAYTHCLAHARYRAQYGPELYDEDYGPEQHEAQQEAALVGADELSAQLGSAAEGKGADEVRCDSPPLSPAGLGREVTDSDAGEESDTDEDSDTGEDFNVDAFIDEMLDRAHQYSPEAMSRWLSEHEALYSLQLKQFLMMPVVGALAGAERLPSDKHVHSILAFFGLDGVGQRDRWIEHSLQVLWQRMVDRGEFDRLRTRHYVHSTAVDRMFFKELTSPRNWLRFAFLLLCPSLPSRTRNVLLEFEAHAPYSSLALFNPAAAGFWRLASDRDRLDWRRWLVVLLRIPLLTLAVAYFAMLGGNPLTPRGACLTAGVALGLWFVLACGIIGWRRLQRFNAERLRWDLPLALSSVMLGVALLAGFFLPDWSIPLSVLTMMCWFAQRKGGDYYAGLFAAVFGGIFVLSAWHAALPRGVSAGSWAFVFAGVYGAASILAHDVVYARIKNRTLARVRGELGWLGWLLFGHAVLTVGALVAGS